MIKKLKKQLEESHHIVLLGHRNPDGDATGATLALCGVLRSIGKDVHVIMPNNYPDNLAWISGAEEIKVFSKSPEEVKALLLAADMLVALDFNAFSRLDELAEFIPSVPTAMIDHHPYPQIETDLLFSDTSVSSTCEYLTNILYAMDWDQYIDKDIATALFVGIMTDTGRFNHNSSNPQTFRMVANLLEKGVNKDDVVDRVFDRYSESRMRLMGFALNEKMEVFMEQGIAIMALSLEEKQRFNFKQGDAEGLVNIPLSIDGVTRSVFLQEYDDMIRMSFRSKGDDAINQMAAEHFNGGGHKNAAGGTSFLSLDETLTKLKTLFKL